MTTHIHILMENWSQNQVKNLFSSLFIKCNECRSSLKKCALEIINLEEEEKKWNRIHSTKLKQLFWNQKHKKKNKNFHCHLNQRDTTWIRIICGPLSGDAFQIHKIYLKINHLTCEGTKSVENRLTSDRLKNITFFKQLF